MKKIKLLSLVLCFLMLGKAYGEPIWGMDYLGMGNKYGEVVLESHPDGFAIGVFTQKDLFGDPLPSLEKILKKKSVPLVRYNLRWSDTHTFTTSDFPKIVAEAKRVVNLINDFPSIECQVSGATEHKLNRDSAQRLASMVLAVIPERCTYVNNPWTGQGSFLTPSSRIINEVHGGDAKRPNVGGKYNFSFDGTDAFDVGVTPIKNRLSDAEVFFLWTSQNNGRRNVADKTPRNKRIFYPTPDLIKALAFLATRQGMVALPKNYLVKPKSDQHSVPPGSRELKPVFIFPLGVDTIQIRSGGKAFTSARAQAFADGRRRYYFGKFGHVMVQEAGNNVFEVGYMRNVTKIINKKKVVVKEFKKIGTANPAFRQGGDR